MKLKKIEIVGFKSFMEKAVFTFPSNIAAVVGPNGCGKSNIVDAIMWAMGEMRPTHLRSRSLEDVIFNGTEALKPLGMAEVSLIFDNDGGAPLEGYVEPSEVQVTRRLFRSGESEYLINKVPCRLKDVRDLFLGTGAGVNAYAMIEQGQVETLINARPQDRRYLIEEAAGVTKYKEKKRETLLKMERTKQNLLRVQDIIGEVHRQMSSLRRQAVTARKSREYREEIKKLEIALAIADFAQLEQELKRVEALVQQKKEEEAGKLRNLASIEEDLETRKYRLMEQEEGLFRVQREIYQAEAEIQREEERTKSLGRELQDLRRLAHEYTEEIERLEEERNRLREKTRVYQEQLDDAERELREVRGVLEARGRELRKKEELCGDREETLQGLRQEVLEVSLQLTRFQNVIESGQRRHTELQERRVKLEEELAAIQAERVSAQQELRRNEDVAHELAGRRTALDQTIREREGDLQCIEADVLQKESQVKEMEREFHTRYVHLTSLKDMQNRFEGYAQGVKAIMTSDEPSLRKGIIGTLADLVDVEHPYETALEAVLGHELQSLLVNEKEEALHAIQYLKKEQLGKVSFLPVKNVQSFGSDGMLSRQDGDRHFLGRLIDFVHVREDYRPLVEVLLDGVWLVKDLIPIVAQNYAGQGIFVTPEGDLWDRKGGLTGGSQNSHPSGIITRKKDIRDLERAVDQKERACRELSQQLEELRVTVKTTRESLENLRSDRFELEKEQVRVMGGIDDTRRELHGIDTKEETLRYELAQTEVETAQLNEDGAKARNQLTDCRTIKEQKETEVAALHAEMQELWTEREALRTEVTELQVGVASLAEREGNLRRSLEELEKLDISLAAQHGKKGEQLQDVQARIQETIERERDSRTNVSRVISARDEKKVVLDNVGEEVKGTREEIASQEAALKNVHGELRQIRECVTQEEIKGSELEMRIQHLTDRIQERYGRSLGSLTEAGDYPSVRDRDEEERRLDQLRSKVEKLGEVNPGAVEEYEDLRARYEFLQTQKDDLHKSLDTLRQTIVEVNRTSTQRFKETFSKANDQFQRLIARLFEGGRGELVLDESSPEPGVNIFIQPPGKKLKNMELLSGGEKAMATIAFIFSLFLLRPTPFCVLDEVDGPLDDSNLDRFINLLKEMGQKSQFVLITHNKRTIQAADALYGVTMEIPGVSKVVSVRLN